MRVLITGAGGTVGSMLAAFFAKTYGKEAYVTGIDLVRPKYVDEAILFDLCSLTEKDTENPKLFGSQDIVVHTAASLNLDTKMEDLAKINIEVPLLLYAWASRFAKQFIFLSSCSVYDTSIQGVHTEASSRVPSNNYELSKIKAEDSLINIQKNGGVKLTILRPGLIYGPEQKNLSATAIVLGSLLAKAGIAMHGGPKSNWVHSYDVARAIEFCAFHAIGGVFNIVEDNPVAIGDAVGSIVRYLQPNIKVDLPWFTPVFKAADAPIRAILPGLNKVMKAFWATYKKTSPVIPKIDKGAVSFGSQDAVFSNEKLKFHEFYPVCKFEDQIKLTLDWYKNANWI